MKYAPALLIAAALAAPATAADVAGWTSFVIREGGSGSPAINDVLYNGVTQAKEFVINEGGMKAGWGTNNLNGLTVGEITQLAITRYDDESRFAAGSGPAVAPYFNIWVTDGVGNYAVIANEPSNPAFQSLYNDGYDLGWDDISNKVAKVYETPGAGTNTSWVHTLLGKTSLTFADVANLVIDAPSAAYIANGANAVTDGAPDELGTNIAYGFNWILGDTLDHYVSGDPGYILGAPVAVPEPASLALVAAGALVLVGRRRG